MLIRISASAEVTLDDESNDLTEEIIRALDGAESDERCSDYLEFELADLGITGGAVKLIYDPAGRCFRVSCEYRSPVELTPSQLKMLVDETKGQWSDGIGEGCFDKLADEWEVTIDLCPIVERRIMRVEQIDDGLDSIPPELGLVRAARDGDLTALRTHLERGTPLENRSQGYTALHMAILYGKVDAALELIARGADLRATDPLGHDPLLIAASSNSIADADAARVARALLEKGVSPNGPSGPHADPLIGEYTPLYLAKIRGKVELAEVLKGYGAGE
jgi:uncharacterized protein